MRTVSSPEIRVHRQQKSRGLVASRARVRGDVQLPQVSLRYLQGRAARPDARLPKSQSGIVIDGTDTDWYQCGVKLRG